MPLLEEPHCPQCLSTLPLSPLWRTAQKDRSGLLRGQVGIVCPRCGAKLRIIQTRANLAGWVGVGAFLGGAYYVESLMQQVRLEPAQKATLVFVVAVVLVAQLMPRLLGPHLAQLRLTGSGEDVTFPLEEDSTDGWVCSGCRERNPANFPTCWNCERPRPAASNQRLERP